MLFWNASASLSTGSNKEATNFTKQVATFSHTVENHVDENVSSGSFGSIAAGEREQGTNHHHLNNSSERVILAPPCGDYE